MDYVILHDPRRSRTVKIRTFEISNNILLEVPNKSPIYGMTTIDPIDLVSVVAHLDMRLREQK